jgi:hypothetical protein
MHPTLISALKDQLNQLKSLIAELNFQQFAKPIHHLSGATAGQHCRHIIELLQQATVPGSIIDYDQRKRDLHLETNPEAALTAIDEIYSSLGAQCNTHLQVIFHHLNNAPATISSCRERELLYMVEHTIHHLALIRVACIELGIHNLPDNFGVAYSTQQFKQTCAQ